MLAGAFWYARRVLSLETLPPTSGGILVTTSTWSLLCEYKRTRESLLLFVSLSSALAAHHLCKGIFCGKNLSFCTPLRPLYLLH